MTSGHFLFLIFEFSQNIFENINIFISSYFNYKPCTCKIIILYPIISSYIMKHRIYKRHGALAHEFSSFPLSVNEIFFSDFMKHILTVTYGTFVKIIGPIFNRQAGPLIIPIGFLETSVTIYQSTLQDFSEEPCHILETEILKTFNNMFT